MEIKSTIPLNYISADDLFFQIKKLKELSAAEILNKKPILAIVGPTASGKSLLGILSAKLLQSEVISLDSRQIYRGMDIVTAKVSHSEMDGISHNLIDICDPDYQMNLAEFRDLAEQQIQRLHQESKVPILVGGTGLYYNAIFENYNLPAVPADQKFRADLEKKAKKLGNEYVFKILQKLNPLKAETIHPGNLRYLIRAIELEKSQSDQPKKSTSPYQATAFAIDWPRAELYQRINQRVEIMLDQGLYKEFEEIFAKYGASAPAMATVGYQEFLDYRNSLISFDEAVEKIKQNSRKYAKRQYTWFRKAPAIQWLQSEELPKLQNLFQAELIDQ
jgi:tRNA dimethylallyltransferase